MLLVLELPWQGAYDWMPLRHGPTRQRTTCKDIFSELDVSRHCVLLTPINPAYVWTSIHNRVCWLQRNGFRLVCVADTSRSGWLCFVALESQSTLLLSGHCLRLERE